MASFEILGKAMRSPGATLTITCGRCGHQAVWSRARTLETFGEWTLPCDLGRGLACSRCGEARRIAVRL